ncbi:MAG TPA: sucrase ferredoxin [Actinomycetota bacterium]|nr:sucrase ferredoxin [Actinomycetota bacterium]
MPDAFRCSSESLAYAEPMAGTASTVRSWLLLEHGGPWGVDAFVDARLPGGFGAELLTRCRAAGVRPLLIRRVGVNASGGACFVMRSGPEPPWIERTTLDGILGALELDLDVLGRGERLGLERWDAPLFLVCTHGRHDPCCAERGRPLALALAAGFLDETWECSHIGGDRFAGNVVAFPHGMYFGRVEAGSGPRVAAAYAGGRIDLDHYRGRSCAPMPVQAAEHALRVRRGLDGVDDLEPVGVERSGAEISATFRVGSERVVVQMVVEAAGPRLLTCRSSAEERPPAYRVLGFATTADR